MNNNAGGSGKWRRGNIDLWRGSNGVAAWRHRHLNGK